MKNGSNIISLRPTEKERKLGYSGLKTITNQSNKDIKSSYADESNSIIDWSNRK